MEANERAVRREQLWKNVELRLNEAVLIEWDGSHRIHVHTVEPPSANLKITFNRDQLSTREMLVALHEWYKQSNSLKFIHEVRSSGGVIGHLPLIAQGDEAFEGLATDGK